MTEEAINPKLKEGKIDRQLIDTTDSTYHEIKRYVTERIEILRKQNDKLCDEQKTNVTRGGILELKLFLQRCEPKEITEQKIN